MNSVMHFEMGANDTARMRAFYETVFGWRTMALGEEMGNYVIAQTTETDDKGMIQTPGAINGGFYKKTEDPASHAPSVVIGVENLKESMQKVIAGGGKLLSEPMDIPGVGTWVSFLDTEGNRVSMMQPLERAA